MVRDGIYYAIGFTLAGAGLTWLRGPWIAMPLFLLGIFCAWFFRDPERLIPVGPVAVSPADGKVIAIVPQADGRTRITIFLNIFDVHVNRSPISGIVMDVKYQKGKFLVASVEAASEENEQSIMTVRASDGTVVVLKQIAGLIARRVICTKKAGDHVGVGERIGLMKFGSRCDVILGDEWQIEVSRGMRVVGGSSILARRAGNIELPIKLAQGIDLEEAFCQT